MTLLLQKVPRRIDISILLLTALCLVLGLAYRRLLVTAGHRASTLDGAVSVEVPTGWILDGDETAVRIHPPALGRVSPALEVRSLGKAPEQGSVAFDIALARIEQERAESGIGYRVLAAENRPSFGAAEGAVTHYAIVEDPPGGADGVLPVVVQGVDILVRTEGGRLFHVTASAPTDGPAVEQQALEAAVASVEVHP